MSSHLRLIILSGFIFAALLVIVPLLYLNWLFEEPEAKLVPSVAEALGATSVLAVFAHPDDEQLVTGLLIHAARNADIATAVLTATKGEAGTPMPQISRLEDLGAVRKAEALKNTWAMGVDHHDVLDFPDGGVEDIPINDLKAAIRARMLRHKPDLVVTFWPESGFSDHPDHKRVGLATERVALDLRAQPVDGYSGPDHIAYALAARPVMKTFAGERGRIVAAHQPPPTYAEPGEGWAKIRGWKIHASQRTYVWHSYKMPAGLVHRLWDKEYYHVRKTEEIPAERQPD